MASIKHADLQGLAIAGRVRAAAHWQAVSGAENHLGSGRFTPAVPDVGGAAFFGMRAN